MQLQFYECGDKKRFATINLFVIVCYWEATDFEMSNL